MRLSTYIQRTRALGDLPVTPHDIEAIGQLIEKGAGFEGLIRKRTSSLTPLVLLGLWRAHRRYSEHQAYLQHVAELRRREGQHAIAWNLLKQTVSRHEVAVLERAEALAPPGRASEHRRRDAMKAVMALWKACLAIVRKTAQLKVELDTDIAELVETYGDYCGTGTLGEIAGHRWLAIRRGERLGALRLTFDLPRDRMEAQVEARAVQLAAVAAGRDAEVLLEALVLTDLEEWALSLKDDEAQFLAIRQACNTWLGMLTADKADHPIVAAVGVPSGGPVGVAITLRNGRMVGQGLADVSGDPVRAVEQIIGRHPVEAVVLPSQSPRHDLLEKLARGFGNLTTIRVDGRAMKAACAGTGDGDSTPVKQALVLARRALAPMDAWLAIDPTGLGLADYQHELDQDDLRAALDDMRVLARAGVKPGDLERTRSGSSSRTTMRATNRPLNPLVKNVDDLRPGMEVNGVVTNITQFGAFINIGLAHEGLVHVSELADHFVNDPNEVVTVGQQVKARVLGVDRGRRRISLSMRPDRQTAPKPAAYGDRVDGPRREPDRRGGVPLDDIPGRGRRKSSGGFGGPRPSGNSNISRAQALADLERLFKK